MALDDGPGAADEPAAADAADQLVFAPPDPPPTGPSRGAYLLAFAGVVVAGLLGAVIGYGIADLSCTGSSCGLVRAAGTVGGALFAAIGVGIVAMLVLRAMAEWRSHPPERPS